MRALRRGAPVAAGPQRLTHRFSRATLVPRYLIELFAGAVCFIIASASFVFSVALDVKQMEEQNEEVRAQRRGK